MLKSRLNQGFFLQGEKVKEASNTLFGLRIHFVV